MSGFVLHPEAIVDLAEIWEYIAADSPDSADKVLLEIEAAIGTVVAFPQSGHLRPDLTSHPLRFHLVRDFLIAYAPRENPLLVLGIIHGRRHPRIIAAALRNRE